MPSTGEHHVLPFAALVGQDQLKLGLLILAVDPRLNGLLIRGHKGTAKSTAARGLADLLPPGLYVQGCRFGCPSENPARWCQECQQRDPNETVERRPPFLTLPLGATEDQLLGSIDLSKALRDGQQQFSPGLLARVNQGVLYVDEVNLLDDHIVDLLLDAAAMGVNIVAREGISISHPAQFLLVGTMNPEEGELRPQLMDRFGLCVEIRSVTDVAQRAEIVSRCLQFEKDPQQLHEAWQAEQHRLTEQIAAARSRLGRIATPRNWCEAAARISLALSVDGHRADVLMVKAAAAIAALEEREKIGADDLARAATFVLPHRLRRGPFDEQSMSEQQLYDLAQKILAAPENPPPQEVPKKKNR